MTNNSTLPRFITWDDIQVGDLIRTISIADDAGTVEVTQYALKLVT